MVGATSRRVGNSAPRPWFPTLRAAPDETIGGSQGKVLVVITARIHSRARLSFSGSSGEAARFAGLTQFRATSRTPFLSPTTRAAPTTSAFRGRWSPSGAATRSRGTCIPRCLLGVIVVRKLVGDRACPPGHAHLKGLQQRVIYRNFWCIVGHEPLAVRGEEFAEAVGLAAHGRRPLVLLLNAGGPKAQAGTAPLSAGRDT
jgi:hypothetical protein